MNLKIVLLTLLFFTTYHLTAQQRTGAIKGQVVDSINSEVLEKATVALYRVEDGKLLKRVLSGNDGFLFTNLPFNIYRVVTSFRGYHSDTVIVEVSKDSTSSIGKVRLVPKADELMTVVVKAQIPPMMVRNDTLVFNPNAVRTFPNATVEDLLKKLPGINVDRNGAITINGKKVEKVYIDGKEFVLGDPRFATQNLTADMIEAIEAYDHQSNRARFTGIRENTNSKDINLRIKKSKRNTVLANATAGVGTSKNMAGSLNASTFRNDYWLMGNLNLASVDTRKSDNGIYQRSSNGDLNCKSLVAKNIDVTVNSRMGESRSFSAQRNVKETFLEDSSLIYDRISSNTANGSSFSSTIQTIWTIDTFNTLNYSIALNTDKVSTYSKLHNFVFSKRIDSLASVNTGNTTNSISSNTVNSQNNLNWQKRFKKSGRTLFADFSYNSGSQKEDGSLFSLIKFNEATEDKIIDQQYKQINRQHSFTSNITYTEPISVKHFLNATYTFSSAKTDLKKSAFTLNDQSGKYEVPDSLNSNRLDNSNSLHNLSMGYNYNGDKLKCQSGATFSSGHLHTVSEGGVAQSISQKNLNWAPSLSLGYQVNRHGNIGFQYSGANQMPTAEMLQPIPDISNPFVVKVGNAALKQQFSHNGSLNYSSYNANIFNTLLIGVVAGVTSNKLSQASLITSGGIQQLQYINVNGVYNVAGNVGYTHSINKGRNGSLNMMANIEHSRDVSYVNGAVNVYKGVTVGQSLRLNYHYAEQIYVNLNATINVAHGKYSIADELKTKNIAHAYDADVTYKMPWDIHLNTSFRFTRVGKQRNFPGQSVSTLNASIFRIIMKNRGEVKLEGFDLLNQNTGFTRVIGNNYVETTETNVLQRYFMLTFKYRMSVNPKMR